MTFKQAGAWLQLESKKYNSTHHYVIMMKPDNWNIQGL